MNEPSKHAVEASARIHDSSFRLRYPNIIQSAIDAATAEKDATIAVLKKEVVVLCEQRAEKDKRIAELQAAGRRDGSWMDSFGACRVCDGEIPHGHSENCDVYKLEQRIAELEGTLLHGFIVLCSMDAAVKAKAQTI